jgi:DNA-binding winged helix-turn-helix (wHTH) protein/Tfp pilus assembly protein PilF
LAVPAPSENLFRFGVFELDAGTGELRKSGFRIRLRQQCAQVLASLLEHPGELVSREELREKLWPGNTFVEFEGSLNKIIVRLRDALGDSAESPHFIETLPRKGYRFIGSLRERAAGTSVNEQRDSSGRPRPQASFAVLPFLFLNAVEERESFSLGFADALITTLGNLEDLIVLPTAAILRYTGASDPLQISRELGVRYILLGNIQKIGPDWRVSVQIFDAEMKKITFAEKYDFRVETVFDMQDQMAARLSSALKLQFRSAVSKTRDRYSADPIAYDAFMRGLANSSGDTPEMRELAIEQLTEAVTQDPEFALAHAVLSYVLAVKYFEYESKPVWLEKAEHHCQQALELDSNLAEAHMSRAYILWSPARNFAHGDAIEEIQRALALQPNVPHAHNRLGTICAHIGRLEEALAFYEQGRRANPQNRSSHGNVQAYVWSGALEAANREIDLWLKESPGHIYPIYFRPLPALLSGDLKTAAALLEDAIQILPDEPMVITLQGMLHAFRGENDLALESVRRACSAARSFGHTHHTYYQIACIHAVLGDTQKSLEWLERTVNTGFACTPFFERDPALAKLRPLPEFQSLVRNLKTKFGAVKISANV